MRISGKLSPEQLSETRQLLRPSWYWPKLLISNLYGLVLAASFFWLFFHFVFLKNWRSAVLCLLANAIVWSFAAISGIRQDRNEMEGFQQSLPEWLEIDAHGLKTFHSDGRTSYLPSGVLTTAVRGRSVVVLRVVPNGGTVFVPLSHSGDLKLLDSLQLAWTDVRPVNAVRR